MSYAIRQIGDSTAILGEGAYWSDRQQALYWVDIKGRKIFRTDPASGQETEWDMATEIGFIVEDPCRDCFLVGLRKGIARIDLVPGEPVSNIEYLARPEDDIRENRFNDGAIDRFGNLWAGTMDDREEQASGNWWHFSGGGKMTRLLSGFEVTNGPAFSPIQDFVFLTDSPKRTIYRAAYDERGLVSGLTEWAKFAGSQGYPDGMDFDGNGLLWVAFWDGACVRALDRDGQIIDEVSLPVSRPTKPVFAPDGRCFVTSARVGVVPNGLNGGIFEIIPKDNLDCDKKLR